METINRILEKYQITTNSMIVEIPISRWKEFPTLLVELGLTKGVEIGTYKGQYAATLSNVGIDLICVDAWTVYNGYKDYGENDLETVAYDEAKKRSEKYGFKLMKAWSLDAVQEFKDESLDFVFIDGNHDFRHVTDDVDEWSKKVRKGGIVSGHDFFKNHHKRFGVREAIPAWCEANQISRLFILTGDKCPSWFYIK